MGNRTGIFRSCLILGKLNIMIPVSLSGFTGYFLYQPHFSSGLFLVTGGILFMAITASVINQLQEIGTDRKMNRTKGRPLPSGTISFNAALIFAVLAFLAGISLFLLAGSISSIVLSLITIIWYNGVYTNLKRITPFAVIPGAVTGALPPLIGWVAAGGEPFSIAILLVQLMFFFGQLPHYWLLLMKYGEEYRSAGLPSLTSVMSRKKISFLVIAFVTVSAITVALFPAVLIRSDPVSLLLLVASGALIIVFLRFSERKNPERYSLLLNAYFLIVMILLISDRIIC